MADFVEDLFSFPASFPGMEAVPSPYVYLMGCGKFSQFCCTLRSLADPGQYCPFCPTELGRRGRLPITTHGVWQLLENEFPNPNTERMLLITPVNHRCNPGTLTSDDWTEIGSLFEYCQEQLDIKSGGVVFRFGDPHQHAGTIAHMHINVIAPICGKEFRIPLAKHVTDHAENYRRLIGFRDELRGRGGADWLFSPEGIVETQPRL